jgi:hypothetical protein
MKVVSFDCATKSLGISIIDYNMQFDEQVSIAYQEYISTKANSQNINEIIDQYIKLLDKVNDLVDNKILIEYMDVVDIIPGKKVKETSIVERTAGLYNHLTEFDAKILCANEPLCTNKARPDIEEYTFLIEYQMGPNDKSRAVASQIMMFFSKYCGNHGPSIIKVIGPSLKNKISIGGDDAHYSNFIEKYTTNYAANKNHAKYNFIKLLAYLGKERMIKHIKKSNIDDIADSVMMSIAYYLSIC